MASIDKVLLDFFKTGRQKKFREGEVILRGEEPTGVMLLVRGYAKVYSISDSGNHYLHVIYKPGEAFPLIWAVMGVRRRVFYEAISDLTVYEVSRDNFLKFIRGNPAACFSMLNKMAEQFYVYADRLDNLEYKVAHERVVYRLIFLAGRFGEPAGERIVIKAPITHEMIAESINLARETVSRELEKLERQGLVGRVHGHLVINDIRKLSSRFSEPVTLNLWGLDGPGRE